MKNDNLDLHYESELALKYELRTSSLHLKRSFEILTTKVKFPLLLMCIVI